MNTDDEPIQLGLLPNCDVPMCLLQQEPQKTCKSVQKPHLSAKIRWQVQLDQVARERAAEKQSHPDANAAQFASVWERSQEFEINVEDQIVRVNFRGFYFRRSSNSSGVHHFDFYGHISSTGYRSDFLQAENAVLWSSPVAYATHKAQELHQELLKEQRKFCLAQA